MYIYYFILIPHKGMSSRNEATTCVSNEGDENEGECRVSQNHLPGTSTSVRAHVAPATGSQTHDISEGKETVKRVSTYRLEVADVLFYRAEGRGFESR
jgi:hypothetical protein